jgi:hypothetical protein
MGCQEDRPAMFAERSNRTGANNAIARNVAVGKKALTYFWVIKKSRQ